MPKKIDYKLSPCPFCGSAKAPTVTTEQESAPYMGFESVVCDMTKGECGASSGYCLSKGEAVSKWNARPEQEESEAGS